MKAIISLILGISMLMPHGAGCDAENWYLKRGKDGEAPVFPASAEYITEQNGFYMDTEAYSTGEKVIYLTFDAGYENGNVEKILDVLKEKKVTGAFFILSNLIKKNPELVKRMASEGHLVCNHTAHHKDMSGLDEEAFMKELHDLETLYTATVGGEMPKYYRPPEGKFSRKNL